MSTFGEWSDESFRDSPLIPDLHSLCLYMYMCVPIPVLPYCFGPEKDLVSQCIVFQIQVCQTYHVLLHQSHLQHAFMAILTHNPLHSRRYDILTRPSRWLTAERSQNDRWQRFIVCLSEQNNHKDYQEQQRDIRKITMTEKCRWNFTVVNIMLHVLLMQ